MYFSSYKALKMAKNSKHKMATSDSFSFKPYASSSTQPPPQVIYDITLGHVNAVIIFITVREVSEYIFEMCLIFKFPPFMSLLDHVGS